MGVAVIKGAMRLPFPTSYEVPFDPIRKGIENAEERYTINIRDLEYLNSSGVSAFGRLFVSARKSHVQLDILASREVPWQTKGLSTLQKLWDGIELHFS